MLIIQKRLGFQPDHVLAQNKGLNQQCRRIQSHKDQVRLCPSIHPSRYQLLKSGLGLLKKVDLYLKNKSHRLPTTKKQLSKD